MGKGMAGAGKGGSCGIKAEQSEYSEYYILTYLLPYHNQYYYYYY